MAPCCGCCWAGAPVPLWGATPSRCPLRGISGMWAAGRVGGAWSGVSPCLGPPSRPFCARPSRPPGGSRRRGVMGPLGPAGLSGARPPPPLRGPGPGVPPLAALPGAGPPLPPPRVPRFWAPALCPLRAPSRGGVALAPFGPVPFSRPPFVWVWYGSGCGGRGGGWRPPFGASGPAAPGPAPRRGFAALLSRGGRAVFRLVRFGSLGHCCASPGVWCSGGVPPIFSRFLPRRGRKARGPMGLRPAVAGPLGLPPRTPLRRGPPAPGGPRGRISGPVHFPKIVNRSPSPPPERV